MADVNVPELVPEPVELIDEDLDVVAGGKLTNANPGGQPHGASQITTNLDGGYYLE